MRAIEDAVSKPGIIHLNSKPKLVISEVVCRRTESKQYPNGIHLYKSAQVKFPFRRTDLPGSIHKRDDWAQDAHHQHVVLFRVIGNVFWNFFTIYPTLLTGLILIMS